MNKIDRIIHSIFEEIVRAYPHVVKQLNKQRAEVNDIMTTQRSLMSEEEAKEYDEYLFLVGIVDSMETFIKECEIKYGRRTL